MKKNFGKALFSFVIAGMMTLSMFSAGTKTVVNAETPSSSLPALHAEPVATNVYTTSASDTAETIEKVLNGTLKNNNQAYDGIVFNVDGKYNFDSEIALNRAFTIETAEGKTVTVNHGFSLQSGTNLLFKGSGSFIIDGENTNGTYGLVTYADDVHVTFDQADVTIQNTVNHYGIYYQGNYSNLSLNVIASKLTVKKCANSKPTAPNHPTEGGVHFDDGTFNVTSNSTVVIEDNGYAGNDGDGDFYSVTDVNISGSSTFTVNTTITTARSVVSTKKLTISDHAVMNVNNSTSYKAINGAWDTGEKYSESSKIEISGGAQLNVSGNDHIGIRKSNITVNDGTLNVQKCSYSLEASKLNANSDSFVTLNGSYEDAGTTLGDLIQGYRSANVITGGSVMMQSAGSVINGIFNKSQLKIDSQPVNLNNEILTRFDLNGVANKTIAVGASATAPGYDYTVGADHNGVAYVWAPAVTISIMQTAASTTPVGVLETIRGNSLATVGGALPAAPSVDNATFVGWKNITDNTWFTATTEVDHNITIIPVYAALQMVDTPIDLLESKTSDGTYVNGPLNADANDSVYYQTSIDMSRISEVLSSYQNSDAYVSGEFTLTVTGDTAMEFAATAGKSNDINTYFQGASITAGWFELADDAQPTYDAATNTMTFKIRTTEILASGKLTGKDISDSLASGITAKSDSNNYLTVNDNIATAHYGRTAVTFIGSLLFSNKDNSKNILLNLTGSQAANGADPANANGTKEVTATVDYRTTNTVSADSTTVTYDGAPHTISNVKATVANSTYQYSIVAPYAAKSTDWSATLPTFIAAGKYTVYVKALNEYADDATTSATVTINSSDRPVLPGTEDKPTPTPATTDNTTRPSMPSTNDRASTPTTSDATNAGFAAGIMSGALLLAVAAYLAKKKYCK